MRERDFGHLLYWDLRTGRSSDKDTAQFFDVSGEATRDRQHFSLVFDKVGEWVALAAESGARVGPLPLAWVVAPALYAREGKIPHVV